MDDKDLSGRRKPSGVNQKNYTEQINRKDNQSSFVQTSIFRTSFKENLNEEMKERNDQVSQIDQQLDQYNEDLESTKSFEIQKDDINEYFDYQSQKTTDIQQIRKEIQNLEKEKNFYLPTEKQQNQRHSFPLQNGNNRNPFKNISVVENNINPMNNRNISNLVVSQSIQKENNNNNNNNNNNCHNSSNSLNFKQQQQQYQQQQNSKLDNSTHIKQGESSNKTNLKYLEGLSMQRGDYSSRNEDDSPINLQQQIQQQYQLQLQQQQPTKISSQQGLQQKLDENRASQEEKIRQLEQMIQVQNQFMEGFQNQQDSYYARLYGDIKKQYESYEMQAIKEKKEMEEVIVSLKKQLKISQEDNQKKQKSLMKILNYYNLLKVDYEKLAIKYQQNYVQSNQQSIQNQQQISSFCINPSNLYDIDSSEYGIIHQNASSYMNSSSERGYLRQYKENHSLERQSYSNNMVNIGKDQNSLRENINIPPTIPLEYEDNCRKSIDSDGISIIKGYRNTTKSINGNPTASLSGKQRNASNGNGNIINIQNITASQHRDDQNVRESYQQRSSFIKNSISAGNTTTSKGVKLQHLQQQFSQDQIQGRECEEFDEDINLFCEDDDLVVRQSLENNTKLFDNFFSPRGATTTTTQTKYTVTGSTSTSSYEKMFRSDEKILEKQYWSSDLRENTETQPFSITKQSMNKKEQQHNNKHKNTLSNQQQYQFNQCSKDNNQTSTSSSQTSLTQPYEKRDSINSISPKKNLNTNRVECSQNQIEEGQQIHEQADESNLSFTKQQELKYSQNLQQSQLFKKALQNTNKHQNPVFLSHNDNIEFEIQNIQRSQRNNHAHSVVGTSIEGLPINISSNSQTNASNMNNSIKIQDSFNKLLSKSFSKISNPNNNNMKNSDMNNTSNSNINQDNSSKSKQVGSGSSTSSSQVSGPASSQIFGSNTQKSSKLLNSNLTISTAIGSTSSKNNLKTNSNSNNKISGNISQIEFQPSPKLTQKKKNFPNQINQYSSINNGSSQQGNGNSAVSTSAGGFFSSNYQALNDGQINSFFKKEKMITEPSESTEKSIIKQLSQRQNSQGFQQSQNNNGFTNFSNDLSQNYNLTERYLQQKNNLSSVLNSQQQTASNQNNNNSINNAHQYQLLTKQSNQSQSSSQIKRNEGQLVNQVNHINSNSTKQLISNSYQLAQAKHQSNSQLMSATSQYQIKTVYDNNYLNHAGTTAVSSKSKNSQISSHQQLNCSSHLDISNSNTNKSYNNQLQQQQPSLNNLNKKLLSEKVNKLLQGKKQQSSNYNSTNNSENVNNINTSYSSTNNVGMILSPTSKKQQSYQHNQYNQNNPNTSLYNTSSFSKDAYSSKQRFHTLEN